MKRTICALSITLACALGANAQKAESSAAGDVNNHTSAAATGAAQSVNLESGTQLTGKLQNAVDVRKARVGDPVVLKTTKAIKSGGKTVVGKGAKLVGRVTEVTQKVKGSSQSRVGILFDRLEQGSLAFPISATISSLTSGSGNIRRNDEEMFGTSASSSTHASSTSRTSSGNSSGLLQGAGGALNSTTSAVGNVVGGATSTAGSTVNSTTNAVGGTATGVGSGLGRIQISESSSTSVEGSSVLSLQGENLRLEKGTNFNLVLTQSASVGTARAQ